MNHDSLHPVIAGVGQLLQRCADPAQAEEPLELMDRALRSAAEDAGAPELLSRADSIRVAQGMWSYSNPASLLRERFGATGAQTALAPISGNMIQVMISDAAREIAAGRREVVLVTGAETQHSGRRARQAGIEPRQTVQTGSQPDLQFPHHGEPITAQEVRWGLGAPTHMYSLFENAIRHQRGESPAAHRDRIAALWAGFSAVAADNPNAWIRDAKTAEQIATASADNRMIAFPYTKLMTANMVVDQAAGVIVCSEAAARRAGVPAERLVYLHAATDGPTTRPASRLWELHEQPAVGITGRRALELARIDVDDIAHLDLYSCFPSAVQIACEQLGIDPGRPLTVTGGLTFGGGPFNSYVLHSTARMCEVLRSEPGSLGLVSSLGGYLAKHAFAIYSTQPPRDGFRYAEIGDELARLPQREVLETYEGEASVESFVVHHGADGSGRIVAACRTPDDRRAWAGTTDAAVLEALTREELCGQHVRIGRDDEFRLI